MIEAALDTSQGISLAIAEDNALIYEGDAPFERRASDATLVPWIEDCFRDAGVSVSSVTRWTLGTGPGSFTGLRCGIALVKGICLQTAAVCRGLPSSLAVASQALAVQPDATEILVLNDARRGQLIVTRYGVEQGRILKAFEPARVMGAEEIESLECTGALASVQQTQIEKLLLGKLLGKTCFFDKLVVSHLLFPEGWDWPDYRQLEETLEPVYVRPAVFVEPKVLYG